MLELHSVSKAFDSLQAVDKVSLHVQKGQIIGLIGPNGSGKSTLLNLIAGTQQVDSGEILLDGVDIAHRPAHERFRAGIARSYQDPSLFFRMTALDNTLLPAPHQSGERPLLAPWTRRWARQEAELAAVAGGLLEQVQLRHQFDKPASDLSGGQMKLLEIGRSLMGEPRLLLLDEPTAGVAPALAYAIFEQIERLRRERALTFVIVEHRLEILFDFVDSVSVMHLGRVIAQGAPAQVAADAQVREVYFGE